MTAPDPPAENPLLAVIASLTAQLAAQHQQAATDREAARRQIERLVKMVEGLTAQLDELLAEHDAARRAKLAELRSEAEAALAAQAADAEGTDDGVEGTSPTSSPPEQPRKRGGGGRGQIPAHIPRNTTKLHPGCCSKCGGDKLDLEKVLCSEEWDYVRAHLRARRTERSLCTCRDCGNRVIPDQPPMPFDRASCTFAVIAWLCFAKAGLFLPLDRIQRDFEDQGAHIASSTLTRWWQRGADLLLPIAASLRMSLLADTHIRTDGTGLLVVFPRLKSQPVNGEARPGETDAKGYLVAKAPINGQILIFGNDEHAVYWYTATKHGHHVMDFLTLGERADGTPIRWKGTITADAVSSHDRLFTDGDRTEAGCNAHGLRKFRDDEDKAPLLASRGLAFIRRFYAEEDRAKIDGLTGAALLAWRQKHIAPVAEDFRAWIDCHLTDLLPSNPVRKAMQYYINHWDALTRFLTDPLVELDNNWSERALRSVNLIRNNSLYAGGEEGAVRLCTLLSLIGTARLLGLNPYDYLLWALSKVVPHRDNRGLAASELTPAAYQAAQERDAL
ncbi:MAG: IS66 family transposase [Oligoflexia bacterium]|nr:IS66 family transposase [Oligoflexia bacterium]